MKDLLTEIKNSLYEELGISKEVTRVSNDIISQIIKDSKKLPISKVKTNTINYQYNNNLIEVEYVLYYVIDEEDFNETRQYITAGESNKINTQKYYLKTNIVYRKDINQYIDYNGMTQHEFEHIYQMIRSGNDLLKDTSIDMYGTALSLMKDDDVIKKLVGYVVYYNNKFEKDAFVNAIYKQIMDNNENTPTQTLKNTITYQNILTIKTHLIEYQGYKNKIETIVKTNFNKSYKWFYKMTCNVVKTYISKMGKILMKAYKDKNNMPLDGNNYENLSDLA